MSVNQQHQYEIKSHDQYHFKTDVLLQKENEHNTKIWKNTIIYRNQDNNITTHNAIANT